ncbi:TetR family transcriptional regulator [Rhodococcoides kyotonense]|uniref:DNA-binding transcriptional regulator, AcrR family n=1 Tax=Rhodococcoides kyotonense TaxID=398843 RepID=A0A239JID3_9NOCA|nr:TetR family transcriptional regulator [Rhodococcus kyotonensis]SNT05342.1 DNA-binding transcriptional regulator, AcrR family [Rhodococcus kyotonensis]
MRDTEDPEAFRLSVAKRALDLFSVDGYDATSVDDIAEAAGISRRTFFRQFRGKDDVIFADHEILLTQAAEFLDQEHDDPWVAVCDAAQLVFDRFSGWKEYARLRYQVVHVNPALRDREIVTVFRYERLFVDYLRRAIPEHSHLETIQYCASVTATHNYMLRRMIRDGIETAPADLQAALSKVRAGFEPSSDEVVVAVFPRGASRDAIARALGEHFS